MTTYTDCKTVKTGIYKPHTIYICGSYAISIVYWKPELHYEEIAIAIDINGNKYKICKTQSIYGSIGFLAFPLEPEKIPGFYPWL